MWDFEKGGVEEGLEGCCFLPAIQIHKNQVGKEQGKKLILAREQLWRRTKAKASLSAWMDAFVNSGSEVEHEAFLATWLSMIAFSSFDSVWIEDIPSHIQSRVNHDVLLAFSALINICNMV